MVDFIRDNSKRVWLGIATKTTVPTYVNTAEISKEAADTLLDSEFADPVKRIFPLNNAANTWISGMYLKEAEKPLRGEFGYNEYGYLEYQIEKAAKIYGIEDDMATGYKELEKAIVNPEDLDSSYGWIIKDASGEVTARKFKIVNKTGVLKAASYFDRNRSKYPIAIRRQVSKFIIKKAYQYGEDTTLLPDSIIKEAGAGIPDIGQMVQEIERRALMVKDAEIKDMLNSVAAVFSVSTGTELNESLEKIAELIDSIDKLAGLDKKYGKGIQMPADIVYSIPCEKAASDINKAIQLGSYVFDITKLASLDPEDYSVLGETFINTIKTASGTIDSTKLKASLEKLSQVDKYILEDSFKD